MFRLLLFICSSKLPLWMGVCLLSLAACNNPNTPLDAATRNAIDSISSAQINLARIELDSLCEQRRRTELPRLVDSIKQKRLREIQEQLKSVPQ